MIASKLILIPCIPKTPWGAVFVCRSNDFPRKAKALTIVSFFFLNSHRATRMYILAPHPEKCKVIAVVSLQTFHQGKLELLTVYLGKLDILGVTDFSLGYLPRGNSFGAWICLENNRLALDSYPKAIAWEK